MHWFSEKGIRKGHPEEIFDSINDIKKKEITDKQPKASLSCSLNLEQRSKKMILFVSV